MFHQSVQAGFVLCVGLPLQEAAAVARLLRESAVVLVTSDLAGARMLLEPERVEDAVLSAVGGLHAVASEGGHGPAGPGSNRDLTPGEVAAADGSPAVVTTMRRPAQPPERLHVGELSIDLAAREVLVAGKPIHLSAREFDLLSLLASDVGRAWSFAALTQQIWGTDFLGDKEPLTSTVKRVRRRLGASTE